MWADLIVDFADHVLFISCVFIMLGSIFISFRLRFIQLRFFPALYRMLKASVTNKQNQTNYSIPPHKALLTAMSTTIGIGTIVGPVIAIHLGGPGALLGFILTAFFGSAATFTEVNLCIKYRKKLPNGEILGGPMQYLKHILTPFSATWYAVCCCILMTAWSSAQANQLAAILDSPLLGAYRVSTWITGALLALFVILILVGGIKRVSSVAAKMVPIMFALYIGASLWILFSNVGKFGMILDQIFSSIFSPYAMASGVVVGGIVSAMRWGVFKGTQATEAGIGTQTIPHSMAETNDPMAQGMLAMVSTYSAGMISFLSGCVTLMTETWQDPDLPLGISMVASSFQQYFPTLGITIITISTFLFAFTTILGNSFNGTQCYGYMTSNKKVPYYYAATAIIIFLGCISSVKIVWSVIDLVLACMALPHMAALMKYAYANSHEIVSSSKARISDKAGVEHA